MNVEEACTKAMRDINTLKDPAGMNCLAFDRHGNTISASTNNESVHFHMDVDMEKHEERKGVTVRD